MTRAGRILAALGLGVALLGAGCSVPTDESAQPIAADNLPDALRFDVESTTTTTDPPQGPRQKLYLLRQRTDAGDVGVVEVFRDVEAGASPEEILRVLFGRGGEVEVVTETEQEAGLFNGLSELDLLEVTVEGGTAAIDIVLLDIDGEVSGDPIPALRDVAAQLVWSATEIDGIDDVLILVNGEPTALPTTNAETGDSLPDEPVDTDDYERYGPEFVAEIQTTTTTAGG